MANDRLDVQAFGAVNGSITFGQRHEETPALLTELGGVIPHVPQALHDHALALEPAREAKGLHLLALAQHLTEAKVDPAPGCLDTPPDPTLGDGLAGHAGERVDRPGVEGRVRIVDPRHLARARAVVRRRHVDARADEALLDQLGRVPPGGPLELFDRILLRVDLHTALGPAKRHVNDGTLVGHEGGERLDLILVDLGREPDPALDGQAVLAVLDPPPRDDFVAAAGPDGKLKRVHAVADLDLVEQPPRVIRERGRLLEVDVDRLKEARRSVRGRHAFPRPNSLRPV